MKTTAIILSAGNGTRMKSNVNKNLLLISGWPLLLHTLQIFQDHPLIHSIVLVVPSNHLDDFSRIVKQADITKITNIVTGGNTRQASCWSGLQHVKDGDLVAVHDGARPLVSQEVITQTIQVASIYGAAVTGTPIKDTIKEVASDGLVVRTPKRNKFWSVQTPQVVRFDLLCQAHESAQQDYYIGSDEASLVERLGHPVKIVKGDYTNVKATTPEDLIIIENIITQRKINKRNDTKES